MEKTKTQLQAELAELEELEKQVEDKKSGNEYKKLEVPFKVGGKYFIRTVTYFATGKVKAIVGNFLVLGDAAWIADTGRFSQALKDGVFSEVEPVEVDMFVNLASISDAFDWNHDLPRKLK